MASSSLSSLGLGSSGVLTYDTIDKLRSVDESAILTPIDNKLKTNTSKKSDLSTLTDLTKSLESVTKSLGAELSYLQRSATASNSAVSVTAVAGAKIENFSIHVNTLAQRDIYQSNGFETASSTFASSTTTAGTVIAPTAITTDGSVSTTESTLVSFNAAAMSTGDTLTIGGLTLTATGSLTQAEVVAAFSNLNSGATAGNSVGNGTWSGTLTGFNSSAASGTDLTFTSTTANSDVTDLIITAAQEPGGTTVTVPDTYTLSINIGDTTYNLDIGSGTTLTQLADMINDKTGGKITASLLNVGGTNPYKLIIKSNEVGASNAITFNSTSSAALKNLGLDSASLSAVDGNHLQSATDASFTYNGVSITRTTNSITDLVNGATITLNEKQTDTATQTNISITQDLSGIKDKMSSLVKAYNELMASLKTTTKYDVDTKEAGTFQSASQVKNLSAAINRQLLSQDENGRSILDYGISLDSTGTLSFDSTLFDTKISGHATELEDFFRGSTTYLPTSYTSKAISSNALTIATGEFQINGINIIFNTVGTDATSNALALKNAINAAGITGIEATIGSDNNVTLSSVAGYDIEITGDSAQLALLGFNESTTYGDSTSRDGFFTKFDDLLNQYISGTDSIFGLFGAQLDTEKTSLTKQRAKSVASLDKKYETMATRFAAYDLIISQLNTQFETLSQQIKASYNTSN